MSGIRVVGGFEFGAGDVSVGLTLVGKGGLTYEMLR